MSGDMTAAIVPKSDQLNSDDLIAGPITITITGVSVKTGEQPIAISYDGDKGKPYKCCKSMARLMVHCWGADSKAYVGRSMTLYRDPAVTWAGMAVGGIRISHMSDIDGKITMALTATKQSRKPYTVKPLEKNAAPPPLTSSVSNPAAGEDGAATSQETITPDEAMALEARCTDNSIKPGIVKKYFAVALFGQMTSQQLADAHALIDSTLADREAKRQSAQP